MSTPHHAALARTRAHVPARGRARTRSRSLAVAITLVLGLTMTAACEAPTSTHSNATVEVDLYSGRENPVVELEPATADALAELLDTKAGDAWTTIGPIHQLGFSGLVVTLDTEEATPSTVRIMPRVVYVTDTAGTVRISDFQGEAFDLVWESVRDEFDLEAVNAVEAAR